MKISPKVSVIIPVYNTEKYLRDCLDSVLSQTLENIEIICVNDGSTDKSLDIIHEYEIKDGRITVITQSNRGQGAARNIGIKAARGEYLSFVDSDDIIVADCLEKLYRHAVTNKLEIVGSEIEVRYESDDLREFTKEDYYIKKGTYSYVSSGKKLFADMIHNDDFCVSANILFIKRKWLIDKKINFPENIYFEDAVFCLNCYAKAKKMKQIPFRGYIYRVRQSSTMTSAVDGKRVVSWLEVFKHELKLILNNEDNDVFQIALAEYIKLWAEYVQNVTTKVDKLSEIKLSPTQDLIKFLLTLEKLDNAEEKRNEEKLLLLGFEKMIIDSKNIIIYGAGEVGQNVTKYLNASGLGDYIRFYAVSEKSINKPSLNMIPIRLIDDIQINDSYLILLCSNENNQLEMKERLKMLGYGNYFALAPKLRKLIRERANEKR